MHVCDRTAMKVCETERALQFGEAVGKKEPVQYLVSGARYVFSEYS